MLGLRQWLSTVGSLAPEGTWVMFRDTFIVMTGSTGLQYIDARDVVKQDSTLHQGMVHPKVSKALKMRNPGLKSSVGIHITGKYGCLSPNQT